MNNIEIDHLASKLYDYGRLRQDLRPANAIVALGNMDIRIATKAAQLWHEGLAPVIVASGGVGRLTPKAWSGSEAAVFADVIRSEAVPDEKVLVEDRSTNIPENIRFAVDTLKSEGYEAHSLILVALPFAERRILALCQKQFPELAITMASSDTAYVDFTNEFIDRNEALNLIVGELDRIRKFPAKGFSVTQEMPDHITDAIDSLIKAGFDKYQVV